MEPMSRGILLLAFSVAFGIACERDPVSAYSTVRSSAGETIVISPASVVLQPAEKEHFTAKVINASGDTLAATPAYTATGGRITGSGGWYTAGSIEGAYQVVVTDQQTGAADTAAVIIGDSTPAPAPPPPDSTPVVTAVFASDWRSGTGSSDAAVRDTAQAVPWDGVAGNGSLSEVVPATGLDFPSAHALLVRGGWRSSPAGAAAENPRLNAGSGHLPVPAVGQSLFYRWYIRVVIPDSYVADDLTHPIQDGTNGSVTNWQFEVTNNANATWNMSWNVGQNAWPNNRWFLQAPLNKNQTYRVELQIQRTGTNAFNLHARVYDASNTLRYSDADFRNANGSATLAGNPSLGFTAVENLAGFQVGFNGLNGGQESDYPIDLYYQGGVAISRDGWLGAYRP